MFKASPPVNPHQSFDKPNSKSASIKACRPKLEVDYITYVVEKWQKDKEIRYMEEGDEKEEILKFCQMHKN